MIPGGNLLTVDAYVFQYDATGTNSEIYHCAYRKHEELIPSGFVS